MFDFKVGDRVFVGDGGDAANYFGPGTVTRVYSNSWVAVQSDTGWDEHTLVFDFETERLTAVGVEEEVQWTSSVEGATPSSNSTTSTPTTEPGTDAVTDASLATRPGTRHGSGPTGRRSAATTALGTSAVALGSEGTGSTRPSTTVYAPPRETCVLCADSLSPSSSKEDFSHSPSTTITFGAASAVFSVLPATLDSGNSQTIRVDWKLPPGTSVHPSSERFYQILCEAGCIHASKQSDYGRDDDPFSNVRASEAWNILGWIGAMVRLNDKVKRLQSLAQKGELVNEAAVDSFMDIAVYALIARVLYEEQTA